jgi:hypothetical protein
MLSPFELIPSQFHLASLFIVSNDTISTALKTQRSFLVTSVYFEIGWKWYKQKNIPSHNRTNNLHSLIHLSPIITSSYRLGLQDFSLSFVFLVLRKSRKANLWPLGRNRRILLALHPRLTRKHPRQSHLERQRQFLVLLGMLCLPSMEVL